MHSPWRLTLAGTLLLALAAGDTRIFRDTYNKGRQLPNLPNQPLAPAQDSVENAVGAELQRPPSVVRPPLGMIPAAPPPPLPNAKPALSVIERHPQAVLFGPTCGGTIISENWVLTAAHCSLFTSGRFVLAGTNNSADGSGTTVRVRRHIIHPLFSVGPYWLNADAYNIKQVAAHFDFMLAELESPLPLNGRTMAAARLDTAPTRPGLDVTYAGYGAEHHGETMRHSMHEMELSVISDEQCAAKLPQYDPRDELCVVGRPPRYDSACNGDSGSGLMHNGTLLGVLSWVEEDAHVCRPGAIVVSSRVAAVRDWIRQVTGI